LLGAFLPCYSSLRIIIIVVIADGKLGSKHLPQHNCPVVYCRARESFLILYLFATYTHGESSIEPLRPPGQSRASVQTLFWNVKRSRQYQNCHGKTRYCRSETGWLSLSLERNAYNQDPILLTATTKLAALCSLPSLSSLQSRPALDTGYHHQPDGDEEPPQRPLGTGVQVLGVHR
jgi:hypothetical protein